MADSIGDVDPLRSFLIVDFDSLRDLSCCQLSTPFGRFHVVDYPLRSFLVVGC